MAASASGRSSTSPWRSSPGWPPKESGVERHASPPRGPGGGGGDRGARPGGGFGWAAGAACDWVEKCDLVLELPGRKRQKVFFGHYDPQPLSLAHVLRVAEELSAK